MSQKGSSKSLAREREREKRSHNKSARNGELDVELTEFKLSKPIRIEFSSQQNTSECEPTVGRPGLASFYVRSLFFLCVGRVRWAAFGALQPSSGDLWSSFLAQLQPPRPLAVVGLS